MSVPSAELSAAAFDTSRGRTRPASRSRLLTGGRIYLLLLALALGLAALSLLIPSTPSYDPWSWLIWGRETLHANLQTLGGPTWKPLPVVFTTVLALFGHVQPDLWLIVARAGAVLAALLTFKLTFRVVWALDDPAGLGDPAGADRTLMRTLPAALAGLLAMVGLVLTGNLVSDGALGYSEGMLVAAALLAVERHLDGHRHQAFILGFVAALDRPEVWPFWGLYGLWLMWRDPSSRVLVISLAVLTLALWFVPQKLGGGSFTSGVARAHKPRSNSAAYASFPFYAELAKHAWPLVLLRLKVAAALAVGAALLVLGRMRSRARRHPALIVLSACGGFGLMWWVLIAAETQAGFSGNDRYLVLGSAFIEVAGAAGFGWAALTGTRLLHRRVPWLRRGPSGSPLALVATTALAALVFVFGPNFVGPNLINIPRTHRALIYQAQLRTDLVSLINRNGGPAGVLRCGSVMTEGFQVPMVAWYLGVHILRVEAQPPMVDAPPPAPNLILQARDTRHAALLPLPQTIINWERTTGARYSTTRTRTFFLLEDCRK